MAARAADPRIGKRAAQVVNEMLDGRNMKDVMELLGVSRSQFYKWFHGSGITAQVLARMAEQGYDVMFILTGKRSFDDGHG